MLSMEVIYIFFLIFSWVNNFGYEGFGVLLDVLEKFLDKK